MTTEIIRKNLFPNPRFVESGARPADIQQASIDWSGEGQLGLISEYGTAGDVIGGYCRFNVEVEPNTDYVLDCSLEWQAETVAGRGETVSVRDSSEMILCKTALGKEGIDDPPLRFRSSSDGVLWVQFRGPRELHGRLIIRDVQLEPAATYDAAVAGGGLRSSAETRTHSHSMRRAGGAR